MESCWNAIHTPAEVCRASSCRREASERRALGGAVGNIALGKDRNANLLGDFTNLLHCFASASACGFVATSGLAHVIFSFADQLN